MLVMDWYCSSLPALALSLFTHPPTAVSQGQSADSGGQPVRADGGRLSGNHPVSGGDCE